MKNRLNSQIKFFVILLLILSISLPLLSTNSVAAVSGSIYTILVNPSFDCSTRMNISWISLSDSSSITYTKATDKDFEAANTIDVTPVLSPVQFSDFGESDYYSYNISIKGLLPNTEYIFYITDKNGDSSIQKFKTAPDTQSTKFSFLVLSDVHAERSAQSEVRRANEIAERIYSKEGYDFILSTGDMVNHGGMISNWRAWESGFISSNFMNAQTPGNHEYYKDFQSKERISFNWMSSINNNPRNGAEGLFGSYWFIFNNVLFISIDSCAANGEGDILDDELKKFRHQYEWFESVIEDNVGSYKYIVAYQHYAHFSAEGGTPSNGKYNQWKKAFDEFGVDLALSGHQHTYIRTNPLYNNEVSTDNSKGTVFITLPKISSDSNVFLEDGSGLIAKYDATKTSGVGLFDVTDEGINFNFYDANGNICDSTFIYAKERLIAPNKTNAYKAYYDVVEACDEALRFSDLALNENDPTAAKAYLQKAEAYLNTAKQSAKHSSEAYQKSEQTEGISVSILANIKSKLANQLVLNTENIVTHTASELEDLPPIETTPAPKPSNLEKYTPVILIFAVVIFIAAFIALLIILDNKKKKKNK